MINIDTLKAEAWDRLYEAAPEDGWLRRAMTETIAAGLNDHGRPCKGCGSSFLPHDYRQKYHSAKCRNAHNQRAYYRRQRP